MVKTSHHAVFDEAWYLQPKRPPTAQLLYDMGMELDAEETWAKTPTPSPAPYPTVPDLPLHKIPGKATLYPLPFRISPEPLIHAYAVSATKTESKQDECAIEFLPPGLQNKNNTFQ